MTVSLKAPEALQYFEVSSGNTYSSDAYGIITDVEVGFDLRDLLTAGCEMLVTYAVNSAVTAFATGGQASATALSTQYNFVSTCATNFDSVKLPSATAGQPVTVKNGGAAILSVFPATGDAINGLAVNLSINVPVGGEVTFTPINTTTYQTVQTITLTSPTTQTGTLAIKAAANAGNTQTIITNASQAGARTYTIPDAGASGSFVTGGGNAAVTLTGTGGTSTGTMTTLSAQVTSAALTTAGQATHVATITYTGIAATDIVLATLAGGTNTTQSLVLKAVCTTNTITVSITNATAATAVNGTIIFNLLVIKA